MAEKMHLMDMLAPILALLIIMAALVTIFIIYFSRRHKERMLMIEKGVNPKDFLPTPLKDKNTLLRVSLLVISMGIGYIVGGYITFFTPLKSEATNLFSIAFFGGIGLLIAYFIEQKKAKTNNE